MEGVPRERQPVSCVADVVVHDRTGDDLLLFLACDGIWDVLSDADVTRYLQGHLTQQQQASESSNSNSLFRPEDLAAACEDLVALCLEKNSEDNMTAMAVHLGGAGS